MLNGTLPAEMLFSEKNLWSNDQSSWKTDLRKLVDHNNLQLTIFFLILHRWESFPPFSPLKWKYLFVPTFSENLNWKELAQMTEISIWNFLSNVFTVCLMPRLKEPIRSGVLPCSQLQDRGSRAGPRLATRTSTCATPWWGPASSASLSSTWSRGWCSVVKSTGPKNLSNQISSDANQLKIPVNNWFQVQGCGGAMVIC